MSALRRLRELGQSLWLDNITRDLLASGTLARYIDEWCVGGLTSNPTIFEQALKQSAAYDIAIHAAHTKGLSDEAAFFDLALDDLGRAADLFLPIHSRTNGVDGWVSLEVSPLLAYDSAATTAAARQLHGRAARRNLMIKIPGTAEGLPAIEAAIFAGVPVNVTLLFSHDQYIAAADAYLRGIERRIAAGLDPDVASVASVFVSRWDVAVVARVPDNLRNTLGIAVARRCYRAYIESLASRRVERVLNEGGRPQRLLFASTGTKDPAASDVLYVEALAAPLTVDTIPESTLKAFAEHGRVTTPIPRDGGGCDATIAAHGAVGIDVAALASRLQRDGAAAFVKSWNGLLAAIGAKRTGSEKVST